MPNSIRQNGILAYVGPAVLRTSENSTFCPHLNLTNYASIPSLTAPRSTTSSLTISASDSIYTAVLLGRSCTPAHRVSKRFERRTKFHHFPLQLALTLAMFTHSRPCRKSKYYSFRE